MTPRPSPAQPSPSPSARYGWWRRRRFPAVLAPQWDGLPTLVLTKPRWRTAACVFALAGVVFNVAVAVAALTFPAPTNEWASRWGHFIAYLSLAGMIGCMARAHTQVRPRHGRAIYADGTQLRVRFIRDPDRPRGTYLALHKGRPVTSEGLMTVVILTGQAHQVLRIGELLVPVRILLDMGQPIDTGARPS